MTTLSIVYVLTNPAMPNLVKIGYTLSEDAAVPIAQLYSSGVPFPFKLEFAAKVTNAEEVERALHRAFAPNRVNPKREFFSIEPDQAISILKLLHTEDVTAEVQQLPTPVQTQEVNAANEHEARRPNLNFEEMGIPIGSNLGISRRRHDGHSGRAEKGPVGRRRHFFNCGNAHIAWPGLQRCASSLLDIQWSFVARHLRRDLFLTRHRWPKMMGFTRSHSRSASTDEFEKLLFQQGLARVCNSVYI